MIPTPSRLSEQHQTLVIDASVAINLLGSGRPGDLLRLCARRVVVEHIVRDEVQRDPSNGKPARPILDALVADGLLVYERLTDRGYATFLDLTGAEPPNDIGDREAATIAHAEDISAAALLDENKAARIAIARPSNLQVFHTLDLFACKAISTALPRETLAALLSASLRNARMRVAPLFRSWVIDLIGVESAALCPSLGAGCTRRARELPMPETPIQSEAPSK